MSQQLKKPKKKCANVNQILEDNPRNNLDINPQKVENMKKAFIVDDSRLKTLLAPEFQEQIPLR